jgi:hypothetical protein
VLSDLGDGPFRIMFDVKEMRPGCAILQTLGGSPLIASAFHASVWLLSPTPDLHQYELTRKQLEQLVEMVHKRHLPSTRSLNEQEPE